MQICLFGVYHLDFVSLFIGFDAIANNLQHSRTTVRVCDSYGNVAGWLAVCHSRYSIKTTKPILKLFRVQVEYPGRDVYRLVTLIYHIGNTVYTIYTSLPASKSQLSNCNRIF